MFSGLNNLLRRVLPKRLFYRALLIVAVPVIVLQLIITIVFFDSLWIKTNKGMTRTLVNEISAFIEAYESEKNDKQEINNLFSLFLDLNIELKLKEQLQKQQNERWFSPIDRTLRRELKSKFLTENYWFDSTNYKELIDLRIKYENGYFKFLIPKDRVTSSSARIFALWITVPAIIMVIISLIFLKNQTRPIIKLAEASERFGRGEDIEEFRPSGALEIRKAGLEFNKMRERIIRHLNQRSEMLSGISHDLRTPLTRIKLQLEMIKDKNLSQKLSLDVDEMEKMLNDYLQFVSIGAKDKTETFDLSELLENIINRYENPNISKNFDNKIYFNGRKNLIQRCINNLVDNSVKYAKKIKILIKIQTSNIIISIEDDGPGIPESEYQNVVKPFYKIDKSRSETKSSVGLGLSISSDIAKSHGGDLSFNKSNLGGLKVIISLPV